MIFFKIRVFKDPLWSWLARISHYLQPLGPTNLNLLKIKTQRELPTAVKILTACHL